MRRMPHNYTVYAIQNQMLDKSLRKLDGHGLVI
eukprot:CAMPEP_0169272254 /NCGR_PEP_ID=MMETSP1016-20121227/50312_1 /TAXON_ID=342587 /ORGANISM="Karlodinium micrum, Strain CCMP2283" /LENGTH=32 /DNA_ID= /DNA_START= /DNA_END= /DNA_ORIENTATION=